MATEVTIESLFIGTDFTYRFVIVVDGEVVDASGMILSFMLKKKRTDADEKALLTKSTVDSAITFNGTYDANPEVNEQAIYVRILDSDTDAMKAGTFPWELKRMDADFEAITHYGEVELIRSLHRT